jgi:hypothetical protein
MNNLINDRSFIVIFLLTYFSFFVITIGILDIKSPGFGIGTAKHGFPFTYYYSNCYGGSYLLSGLFGNILFAGVLSFIPGVIFKFVWSKFAARNNLR